MTKGAKIFGKNPYVRHNLSGVGLYILHKKIGKGKKEKMTVIVK